MGFLNKIKDKFSENYHSRYEYILAKLFVAWLMLFEIVPALISIISWNWGEISFGYVSGSYVTLIVFWFLRVFLDWLLEIIFARSWKIEKNMKRLPENVWKKTIVQYDLFDTITPSEAAILLYRRAEVSNLSCLVYKWVNEKKVKMYIEDWKKYIEKIQDFLDDESQHCEMFLFHAIFSASNWKRILFNKRLLEEYNLEFNDMVVLWCMKKWYIDSKVKGINRLFISKDQLLSGKPIVKKKYSVWCFFLLLFFPWFMLLSLFWLLWDIIFIILAAAAVNVFESRKSYYINLTDKGKDVLSQIYWYKYYLEHCEEEQINSDLEEGEIYSKHLPYAIALKLNWKIIDKLS